MSWNEKKSTDPQRNEWGGQWTEKKLVAFSKYVWSYLIIMRNHPFWKTIYFDGFAGSGSKIKEDKTDLYKQLRITEEEEQTYKGAAERVLTLKDNLAFDYYYFIDKDENSLKKLEKKLSEINAVSQRKISYKAGDANKWILELAKVLRTKEYAALVFLDPFGMNIDWSTIENLKDTHTDIWILVPTGVIVNRLLDKKGELKYIDKLQSFFGMQEEEIKKIFYKQEKKMTLFGEEETVTKVAKPIEKIAKIYAERMKTIWQYVTEEPLRLDNRNGVPIFHFVFASNNKSAIKIAKDIIKTI